MPRTEYNDKIGIECPMFLKESDGRPFKKEGIQSFVAKTVPVIRSDHTLCKKSDSAYFSMKYSGSPRSISKQKPLVVSSGGYETSAIHSKIHSKKIKYAVQSKAILPIIATLKLEQIWKADVVLYPENL
jgi:hypothetical protein